MLAVPVRHLLHPAPSLPLRGREESPQACTLTPVGLPFCVLVGARRASARQGAFAARLLEDESQGLEEADHRGLQALSGGAEGGQGQRVPSRGVRPPGAADYDGGPRQQRLRQQETESLVEVGAERTATATATRVRVRVRVGVRVFSSFAILKEHLHVN